MHTAHMQLLQVYVPSKFETYFGEIGGALEEIGCSDDEEDDEAEGLKLPEGVPMFRLRYDSDSD